MKLLIELSGAVATLGTPSEFSPAVSVFSGIEAMFMAPPMRFIPAPPECPLEAAAAPPPAALAALDPPPTV